MKIRSRLLLFFLPPLISGIALISFIAAYQLIDHLQGKELKKCLYLVFGSASFLLMLMIGVLFWIAHRLSRPVQKLNNSALAIAAGQYGQSIKIKGPKEIAELANTLNTMSECLHENINRLKENSILREKTYGEYECSMMLAHMMLQKNIDACRSDAIHVKPISAFSENPRGLLLDFPKNESPHLFHIHMAEAESAGFEGMYDLLIRYKYAKKTKARTFITLDLNQSTLHWEGPQTPLLWSLKESKWMDPNGKTFSIEPGDFFFLFNQGLFNFYRSPNQISHLLSRVLKVFAQDGLETTSAMLQKEIGFAIRRKDLEDDIHLLSFQVLNI